MIFAVFISYTLCDDAYFYAFTLSRYKFIFFECITESGIYGCKYLYTLLSKFYAKLYAYKKFKIMTDKKNE